MLEKRPAPWLLPIIVPKGATIDPSWSDWPPGYVVEVEWKWIVMFVLAGVGLYSLAETKKARRKPAQTSELGLAPKRSKTKRLYYMQRQSPKSSGRRGMEITSLPRGKARGIIRRSDETGKEPAHDLFPVYASSADEARHMIVRGHVSRWKPDNRQMSLFGGVGGVSANCTTWQRWFSPHFDREVWKCEAFDPACKPPDCAEKPKTSTARLRVCNSWTSNFSFHYGKDVRRCAKYSPICNGKQCISSPAPKPPSGDEPSQAQITALAKELASEATEGQGVQLAREIKDRGGIASYRGGYLKEEYREIPLHLKKKTGLPLDEMASELGLDEATLIAEIRKAYPKGTKKKRKINWKDFEDNAYRMLIGGQLAGALGQELFPGLKREMVLHAQDAGKSDDPLTRCLERLGWKASRVSELQRTIQDKKQPDLFTGETKKLNASEKELMINMDECLRRAVAPKGIKKKGPPRQMALFGGGRGWFR